MSQLRSLRFLARERGTSVPYAGLNGDRGLRIPIYTARARLEKEPRRIRCSLHLPEISHIKVQKTQFIPFSNLNMQKSPRIVKNFLVSLSDQFYEYCTSSDNLDRVYCNLRRGLSDGNGSIVGSFSLFHRSLSDSLSLLNYPGSPTCIDISRSHVLKLIMVSFVVVMLIEGLDRDLMV